jgi:hypothetical protein
LLGLALAVAAMSACDASAPDSPPSGDRTFHEGGLTFTYPATWHIFQHEAVSSFSILIADLATVDVPPPCITTRLANGVETACSDRFQLDPDSLVVHVLVGGFPGWDVVASRPVAARPLAIGGRRAYVQEGPPENAVTGAQVEVSWTIERPEAQSNYYTITALIRGPDLDRIRAQLEQLIASVRFDPT